MSSMTKPIANLRKPEAYNVEVLPGLGTKRRCERSARYGGWGKSTPLSVGEVPGKLLRPELLKSRRGRVGVSWVETGIQAKRLGANRSIRPRSSVQHIENFLELILVYEVYIAGI